MMGRVTLAGIAATAIGLLSIVAGSRVLTGLDHPSYVVLTPLVWYNVAIGVVSVAAGIGLVIGRAWARPLATIIAAAHLVVLILVCAMWVSGRAVALDSLGAMAFRVAAWAAILAGIRRPRPRP